MAQAEVRDLIARHDKAWQTKQQWRKLLTDAYEFALPQRNPFHGSQDIHRATGNPQVAQTAQGQQKVVDRVFDSTAVNSTIAFANRIQSDLMPPFQRWVTLKAGPMVPTDLVDDVNRALEDVNEKLFAVLQASNFDTANNEALLDLAIGTGALLILEGPTPDVPVMFVPVPFGQVMLEEGPWGSVWGVFRDHNVKIRNIKAQWPDATELPQDLENKKTNDTEAEITLIEATYFDRDDDVWRYEVIFRQSEGGKDGSRLVERTYVTQRWATPRWIKAPGEVYGRGPVIQALPDIKTLNKLVELVLKNASLHVSGVYTAVNDGVLNTNNVVIAPGAVIPVASNGGTRGPSLRPLERTGQFDLAKIEGERLVFSIKESLLDNKLPPDTQAQPRTATEIIQRIKELAQATGAPFGRLMSEYVRVIVQACLEIMERRGLVPKVKVDGLGVKVQVISPLAQVQNINDVEAVVRWLSLMASISPEMMLLSAKVEEVGPWFGERLGVPSELIRLDDERERLQAIAGQLAARQMQQAVPANGGGQADEGGAIPLRPAA